MADPATNESSPDTDRDFDPSADMLIHDYDDEQTLDEEEAMSNDESIGNELDDLQKESEMPMEELLAMYGYGKGGGRLEEGTEQPSSSVHQGDVVSNSEEDMAPAGEIAADGDSPKVGPGESAENTEDHDKSNSEERGSNVQFHTATLLTSDLMEAGSEEDEDYDPEQDEDWKKSVNVGVDYQAVVSDAPVVDDSIPYEGEDRVLWRPERLDDKDVACFLAEVRKYNRSTSQGVNAIPAGAHVQDDEQALYLLLQCEHNVEEAIRRHKLQTVQQPDVMSLWSEEECRNFENGLRAHGKDFFLNQQKVRSRSVREIVQFYYLWKKTERHDAFAARTRLEKKKYALHPGITDYMDRFIDEYENPTTENRDHTLSPKFHSLISGDPKRHESKSSPVDEHMPSVDKTVSSSTPNVDFLFSGNLPSSSTFVDDGGLTFTVQLADIAAGGDGNLQGVVSDNDVRIDTSRETCQVSDTSLISLAGGDASLNLDGVVGLDDLNLIPTSDILLITSSDELGVATIVESLPIDADPPVPSADGTDANTTMGNDTPSSAAAVSTSFDIGSLSKQIVPGSAALEVTSCLGEIINNADFSGDVVSQNDNSCSVISSSNNENYRLPDMSVQLNELITGNENFVDAGLILDIRTNIPADANNPDTGSATGMQRLCSVDSIEPTVQVLENFPSIIDDIVDRDNLSLPLDIVASLDDGCSSTTANGAHESHLDSTDIKGNSPEIVAADGVLEEENELQQENKVVNASPKRPCDTENSGMIPEKISANEDETSDVASTKNDRLAADTSLFDADVISESVGENVSS